MDTTTSDGEEKDYDSVMDEIKRRKEERRKQQEEEERREEEERKKREEERQRRKEEREKKAKEREDSFQKVCYMLECLWPTCVCSTNSTSRIFTCQDMLQHYNVNAFIIVSRK